MPFIIIICRSSHLFKIFALFDKVIRFYPIFDFINQNKQYEQAKNTTTKGKRTLPSRKHQAYVRIPNFMRGIYYYRNPSKHLIMNAIEAYILSLENQLITMPNGYVKDTVIICKELAEGIKAIYENNSNGINKPTNQD
jgi:hypothetical protein